MAYSGSGDFAFGGGGNTGLGYAGRVADGDGTVTAGIYSLIGLEVANGLNAASTLVSGSLTLTNSGTNITVEQPGAPGFDGRVVVGRGETTAAAGTLSIQNGATLTSSNNAFLDSDIGEVIGGYRNVRIGISEPYGGTGIVNVDGIGSRLITDGGAPRISVGQGASGVGTLNITNGGYVGTLSLQTGRENNAAAQTSTVNIDGAGSELRISAVFGQYLDPNYSGASGYTTFGRDGGKGQLIVQNGGSIIQENVDGLTDGGLLRFGRANGDYGYGVVRDAGSSIIVRQLGAIGDNYNAGSEIRVGDDGQGVLKVQGGGSVNVLGDAARLVIGAGDFNASGLETSSQSLLEITSGSMVLVDSQSYSGSPSANGAEFYSGSQVHIANGVNSNGRIVVDGTGSQLIVDSAPNVTGDYASAQLRVGNLGAGYLEVSNNASVQVREFEVATFSRGIDINGTEATSFNYLTSVIDGSYGRVDITNGGQVTTTTNAGSPYRGVRIALSTGSEGIVNVSDTGSTLTSTGGSGRIEVGRYGTGTLNILAGGEARGNFGDVGRNTGGRGYLNIDGEGSRLFLSDAYGRFASFPGDAAFLRVGRNDGSEGSLTITNGGTVDVINDPAGNYDGPSVQLGRNAGSTGYLLVDGADGNGTASRLNITLTGPSNDAYSADGSQYLGPTLSMGDPREDALGGGQGRAIVRNGGQINLSGENARIFVGQGSDNKSFAYTGSSLMIQSAGEVSLGSTGTQRAASAVVGNYITGVGSVTIDGSGSTLSIVSDNVDNIDRNGGTVFGASMVVGNRGTGNLVISNGGQLTIDGNDDERPALIIGYGAADGSVASDGTVQVSGAASSITVQGTNLSRPDAGGLISVGYHAGTTGMLTISDGAIVSTTEFATSNIAIGSNAGASGEVHVDGVGSRLEAAGVLTIGGNGGNGLLRITNGGTATALFTDVRADGILDAEGSVSLGSVSHAGRLVVAGDGLIGTLDLENAILDLNGGAIKFDVAGVGALQSDTLITNDLHDGEELLNAFEVSFAAGFTLDPGIEVTLLETSGGISILSGVASRIVTIDGLDYRIRTDGVSGAVGAQRVIIERTEAGPATAGQLIDGGFDPDFLVGNTGDDTIVGRESHDTLEGRLGADTLDGGDGSDTASYELSNDAVEVSIVSGGVGGEAEGDVLIDIENLKGSANNDLLSGDGANNTLIGLGGNDTINGLAGADVMDGGLGNDRFFVDDANDIVVEAAGEGTDLVSTSVDFTLPDNVEQGSTLGTGDVAITGNALANFITGNGGANLLRGLGGADRLIAGLGDDTLEGGSGNDLLQGQGGADRFVVTADNGDDQILDWEATTDVLEFGTLGLRFAELRITSSGNEALITFDDPAGGSSSIRLAGIDPEALEIGIMADPGGVGSPGGIPLTAGTSGADNLAATNGDDDVVGLAGNDILNGRAGADTMVGGFGDDRYFLDDAGDLAIELQFQGTDQMDASFSFTLAEHVERGAALGGGAVDITGNGLGNFITGSALSNVLRGEDGRDRLIGFDGDDTLSGGLDNDVLEGGLGADVFVFEAESGIDLITDFEVGTDLIDVTALGISFADMTIIDGALGARVIFDLVPGSVDLVTVQGVAAADLRLASFLGAPNDPIVGTSGNDVLFGTIENDELQGLGGADLVDGRAGADVMIGGLGDDRYFVDDAGDVVTELPSEGTDQVTTSVDFTLPENVENANLLGSDDLTLAGNSLGNLLAGNPGANTLIGGEGSDDLQGLDGADELNGGPGSDILRGGAGSDLFVFSDALGRDTITDFEPGIDKIDLTGINVPFSDLFIFNSAGQAVVSFFEVGGFNIRFTDLIVQDLSVTDFITVSTPILPELNGTSGSDFLIGTADAEAIFGLAGNDSIDGRGGADQLFGGTGDDRYFVNDLAAQVFEDVNSGADTVTTSVDFVLPDNVENASTSGSANTNLTGNRLDNNLVGNTADNLLVGDFGNDVLNGGAGNDTLIGNEGLDLLRGGTGADVFVRERFRADGFDQILDFEIGIDKIDLSNIPEFELQNRQIVIEEFLDRVAISVFSNFGSLNGRMIDVLGVTIDEFTEDHLIL